MLKIKHVMVFVILKVHFCHRSHSLQERGLGRVLALFSKKLVLLCRCERWVLCSGFGHFKRRHGLWGDWGLLRGVGGNGLRLRLDFIEWRLLLCFIERRFILSQVNCVIWLKNLERLKITSLLLKVWGNVMIWMRRMRRVWMIVMIIQLSDFA